MVQFIIITLFITCIIMTASAISPQDNSNTIIQFLRLSNTTESSFSRNLTSASVSTKKFFVTCNGGDDLDVSDCKDAIAYLPFNSKQWAFAEREPGKLSVNVMPLPYRRMGSECALSRYATESELIGVSRRGKVLRRNHPGPRREDCTCQSTSDQNGRRRNRCKVHN